MNISEFDNLFSQSIDYLLSIQQKNGSFLSFSSPHTKTFFSKFSYETTFSSSLILSSLSCLPETKKLKKIKKKLSVFLLSQKNQHWSWNYWSKGEPQMKKMPYPDDLDDTFCALNALTLYDKNLISGETFHAIVNILTSVEKKVGGPYRTWLVKKSENKIWQDIDLAVNSNIAYFLFLNEIYVPNLLKFIEKYINEKNFFSPYYPSSFPIIYFISRFYKKISKDKLIKFLLDKKTTNGSFGNPLNTALAVSSLLNLGCPDKKVTTSINYIIKNQKNGVWQPFGFCFDPSINNEKFVSGSNALTTAFCLEAIAKYSDVKGKITHNENEKKEYLRQEKISKKIIQNVKKRMSFFDKSMQMILFLFINKLTKNNTNKQILLLPYHFASSIQTGKIPNKLLIQLGEANLFGWIAYTIYDDFLDNEGDTKTLSLANVCLRESINLFSKILPNNKNFQLFFQNIFDQIDDANYWEITHCRNKKILPNYKNLEKIQQKSFGHALGPLAILFFLGYNEKSQEVKQIMKFFKHYLIARQLNDDAHDWEKDLSMQHINPVVAKILLASKTKTTLKNLQKIFWENVVDEVFLLVRQHVSKAKAALNSCKIISNKLFLEEMILQFDRIAIQTIKEKKQTIEFLKKYKK